MGFSNRYLPLRGGIALRGRVLSTTDARISSTNLRLLLEQRQRSSTASSSSSSLSRTKINLLSTSSSSHSTLLNSIRTDIVEESNDASSTADNDDATVEPSTMATAIDDTIFALSSGFTGKQATAVAVIRISGPQANTVLEDLLKTSPSSKPRLPKYRQAALKKLYHPKDHSILDHALVLSFKGPNSFTGEDLVELQCHGSPVIVQRLLNEVLPNLGCRMAEPGEFTQRAFSQGKLDLVQVEALADILCAETHLQVEQGLKLLDGKVSKTYEHWRKQLISGLAHAEAVIDFGDDEHLLLGDDDDDMEEMDEETLERQQQLVWGDVTRKMLHLQHSMENQLEDGRRGELIREGMKVAIVGPPNAGKSSLFNLLARRDAAIVSPIAGTTRDVLQVSMDLGGIKCTLQDTAGVRTETKDVLELEGIKRAQKAIKEADLIVAMIDATNASSGLKIVQSVLTECDIIGDSNDNSNNIDTTEDGVIDSQRLLLVRNKLDLIEKTNSDATHPITTNEDDGDRQHMVFGEEGTFDISCYNQDGIDTFIDALTQKVVARTRGSDSSGSAGEGALITRARHRQHVEAAVMALERFSVLSREGSMAVDMAAEELRLAASELGRITGAVDVEDVLDVLFTDFCIGK